MKKFRTIFAVGIILFLVAFPASLSISSVNHDNPTVLITGFGPFSSYETNPSQLITESLNGTTVEGANIVGVILPVDFEESIINITQAIDNYNPDIVISLGLAASIKAIHVEKIAFNLKKLDKEPGMLFRFRRIETCGPILCLSTIPTKDIANNINNEGISAKQHFFAGTYVCNNVLYGLLRHISKNNLDAKAGFIHVPLLDSQSPEGMQIGEMINATKIAIKTSLNSL